jgi:hypothetical protein
MSKAGGTISQQAAVHPWLAADAQGNKQTITVAELLDDWRGRNSAIEI